MFDQINKILLENQQYLISISKKIQQIDQRIEMILEKIEEFEVIMDASELLEDHIEEQRQLYNTEWDPYDDEDFGNEYDNYEEEDGY